MSGARAQEECPRSRVPKFQDRTDFRLRQTYSDSRLLTTVFCTQKMKVTPGICMKTKEGEKQVAGIRCQVPAKKSGVRGADVQSQRRQKVCRFGSSHPDSCLLNFKNEGDSGEVDENKGREKIGVRYQVPGVGRRSEFGRYSSRQSTEQLSVIPTPVSGLLTSFDLFGDLPLPANYHLDFHDCHPLP